jgi:hypothetical protein
MPGLQLGNHFREWAMAQDVERELYVTSVQPKLTIMRQTENIFAYFGSFA